MIAAQKLIFNKLINFRGKEDLLDLLIKFGANINQFDIYQNTPLHFASLSGHGSAIEFLLQQPKINILKANFNNKTALELATETQVIKAFQHYFMKQNPHQLKSESTDYNSERNMSQRHSNYDSKQVKKIDSTNEPPPPAPMQIQNSPNFKKLVENQNQNEIGPEMFSVLGMLGKGSFGEVYLVQEISSKIFYAMKVLHKSKIFKHNLLEYALTERNVLTLTNHPFIVKLNYTFQTRDKLFFILDLCPGGDLGAHLQTNKKFTEERTRIYIAEVLLALEHLHDKDIIYRDLKPENIVLDQQGHAMLTDFGLSKQGVLFPENGAGSFCGSVAYLAPEMLKRQGHGKAVDWYLLGVVMFEMLVGIPPFYANDREQLFQNIQTAQLKFPSSLSNDAKSLLKSLLQRNPSKRLGSGKTDASEIKSHPFFNGINWMDVYNRKLQPPIPSLKLKINVKYGKTVFDVVDESYGQKVTGWTFAQDEQNN